MVAYGVRCALGLLARAVQQSRAALLFGVGAGQRQLVAKRQRPLRARRAMACAAQEQPPSALERARGLTPPAALTTEAGHLEQYQFWDEHAQLLSEAWEEYGRLHPEVYTLRESDLHADLLRHHQESVAPPTRAALCKHLRQAAPGVYALKVFTPEFCAKLLAEADHLAASGIPLRRPNSMNRYGMILSELGFAPLLRSLMSYVTPLAAALYPEWVGVKGVECEEVYGFLVRYQRGEDVQLAEHTDTSNVTLNVCLGRDFEGGDLYFKGVRFTPTEAQEERAEVAHAVSEGLLHLGGHRHCALPITAGTRVNLILWATARHGVVRIRPRVEGEPELGS